MATVNQDTEIVFEQKVVDLARVFGWRIASFRQAGGKSGGYRTPVKYDGKGYVDLTMVHPQGRIIFAELKKDKNPAPFTDDQKDWGRVLTECASAITSELRDQAPEPMVYWRLWRPRDGDEIATLLSFGRVTRWRL